MVRDGKEAGPVWTSYLSLGAFCTDLSIYSASSFSCVRVNLSLDFSGVCPDVFLYVCYIATADG